MSDIGIIARTFKGKNGPQPAPRPAPAVEHYAPKPPVEPAHQIRTFGELPTRELDDIIAAAEAEIALLKKDAQAIRDMYVKHTNRIADDIRRLQEGVRLSMETMKQLRDQCTALDEPQRERPLAEGKRAIARALEIDADDEQPVPRFLLEEQKRRDED